MCNLLNREVMKKYRFFIWGMALFLFACGNENTKNPVEEEILPFRAAYEMSSRDSSFFLPVFQRLDRFMSARYGSKSGGIRFGTFHIRDRNR